MIHKPKIELIERHPGLAPSATVLMTIAAGLAVANVYAIQPLLEVVGRSLALGPAHFGLLVTVTQAGYALGLLLLVPLGDRLDRRRLIVWQMALSALALAAVAMAGTVMALLVSLFAMGLLAVTVQTLVAYAGALAAPERRGAVVGTVTSGVIIGILAARFVSGGIGDVGGWRAVYWVLAAASCVIALLLSRTLPPDSGAREKLTYAAVLRWLPRTFMQDAILRRSALFAFVIFATFSIFWTSMALPLTGSPHHLSHGQVGLFGVLGLAGALGARRAGVLADAGRAAWVTGGAFVLLCLSWLAIAMLEVGLPWLGAGILMLDLAVQAIHVTSQGVIVNRHPDATSRAIAGYMMFYSLGSAMGGALSTWAYAIAGWNGVCLAGGGVSLGGLLLWALMLARRRSL
ncbi:MAG: MFS transporter [Sphingomonadales bacterium]|nr:MFS transporter [Sphingomonadales bacterium]MDE2171906.1 MFS transporter [Sphingomonadales bacterium]